MEKAPFWSDDEIDLLILLKFKQRKKKRHILVTLPTNPSCSFILYLCDWRDEWRHGRDGRRQRVAPEEGERGAQVVVQDPQERSEQEAEPAKEGRKGGGAFELFGDTN